MYALMLPVTITIDDRLPMRPGTNRTLFAKVGRDQSVWGPLYEKAYAKYHGSYESLSGGNPKSALQHIYGAPSAPTVSHSKTSVDDMWDILVEADKNEAIVTIGCFEKSKNNLVGGHAYSFIKTLKLKNGTRLVQVRNPWSAEKWTGPWSDGSSKWTEATKKEAKLEELNDGAFYMPIELYKKEFGATWINYETDKMWKTHWLKLDDKTDSPGSTR